MLIRIFFEIGVQCRLSKDSLFEVLQVYFFPLFKVQGQLTTNQTKESNILSDVASTKNE